MFSRNKEGNSSIQSRKHKLIYNRINFAPSPSLWHCWIFRAEISAAAALIAILPMSPLSCKAGAGFVFVWVVLFTPVPLQTDEGLLAMLREMGDIPTKLLGRHKWCSPYFPCAALNWKSFSMQRKSSPGSCWGYKAWICWGCNLGSACMAPQAQVQWDSAKDQNN